MEQEGGRRRNAAYLTFPYDQTEAMTLSDRIAVLRAGELFQLGSPREIYQQPASRFVAGFFGAPRINVVEAGVLGLSGEELAAVRPEHVELLSRPEPGAQEGTVALVELTGAESWVTVDVAGQPITARAAAEFSTAPGGRTWVRVPPDRILPFPR